jgi:hypothetical protein
MKDLIEFSNKNNIDPKGMVIVLNDDEYLGPVHGLYECAMK